MGIVFEPMYDPNNPSVQRGVRICDLPRTGAAALSRKLEVGDELLSINDKTMSRLTFDEIMDFIIEADPDQVNLLFRRPRKGALPTRLGPKPMTTPAIASVKWPDDDMRNKKEKKKTSTKEKEKEKKVSKRSKRDEDSTVVSEEETLEDRLPRRKHRSSRDMYENESFLDMLIDTICGKNDGYCGDRPRRGDDDYYSDEDDTFASMDDSTYVTYESDLPVIQENKRKSKGKRREDDSITAAEETEDDTTYNSREVDSDRKNRKTSSREEDNDKKNRKTRGKKSARPASKSPTKESSKPTKDKYEEDEETCETNENVQKLSPPTATSPPPLGLAPEEPEPTVLDEQAPAPETEEDSANPAPIKEVEYDHNDNGADVSVMESLGGPSLLIEKQRKIEAAKAVSSSDGPVPADIVNNFGKDFPADPGLTREQTIQKNSMKFYSHVVLGLLKEHEPEKVRLLDKLLAKYKGREDHLVQKLSVRYAKAEEAKTPTIPEEEEGKDLLFTNAVNRTKESASTAAAIKTAKERMENEVTPFETVNWTSKDPKGDEDEVEEEGEEVSMGSESGSGSEYSGDSIDGTSPAVIAQVSELLNYVYGKTSVPGQIDRVSTIMRAYEGREAVLLELLETKALIKANGERDNAADLPSFLRNSPALQHAVGEFHESHTDQPGKPVSPLSGPSGMQNQTNSGGIMITDDVSSMSGVSSPTDNAVEIHEVSHGGASALNRVSMNCK